MSQHPKALITGGSRGIGKAICLELAHLGYDVIFTYKTQANLAHELEKKLTTLNVSAKGYELNLSNTENLQTGLSQILTEHPSIDVLVNNAGLTIDGLSLRYKPEDFEALMQVNILGSFLTTQAVLRPMIKAKQGSIIFISSYVGQNGNAGQTAYAATKAALLGMTKSLAKELGSRNIRVNAIAPGFIETDMTSALPAAHKQSILAQIPLASFGQAEDVAKAVAFLASSASRYITGQVIAVNGGLYM